MTETTRGGPEAQNIPANITVPTGSSVTIPATIPTREGYTFVTWNTSPDSSGTSYSPGATIQNVVSGFTLYAIWINNSPSVTLLFEGNGSADAPATNVPEGITAQSGSNITIPGTIPIRQAYRFVSWNTQRDGSGTSYQPNDVIQNVTQNLVLYAQWAACTTEVTVTYYANDSEGPFATNIPAPVTVPSGSNVTVSQSIPVREGYRFVNWNTSPDGSGVTYLPGSFIPNVTSSIPLFAIWSCPTPEKLILTFFPNNPGGPEVENMPPAIVVAAGQCVVLPSNEPTRYRYIFEGWNTSSDGSGRWYQSEETIQNITENLYLYAIWSPAPLCPLVVRFIANDCDGPRATCIPCDIQVEHQKDAHIPLCLPRREGYLFVQWSSCPCCTEGGFMPGDVIDNVTEDIYLYAIWEDCANPPPCPRVPCALQEACYKQ